MQKNKKIYQKLLCKQVGKTGTELQTKFIGPKTAALYRMIVDFHSGKSLETERAESGRAFEDKVKE